MTESWMDGIQTPALVVDVPKLRENIAEYQRAVDATGTKLRPHTKTHKMPRIAKMQLEAGAQGIAVAKISEAEVMADAGIDDILITYPIIGRDKLERLAALNSRLRRLIVEVESLEGARGMSALAQESGQTFEVICEVDTARVDRTGFDYETAVDDIVAVAALPGLSVVGIFAYAFMSKREGMASSPEDAGTQEGELAVAVAEAVRARGVDLEIVAGGSSPTGRYVAAVEGITEVHPGTYVFYDTMSAFYGITQEQCAAAVIATVVASNERRACIDAGSKSFSTDIAPHAAPLYLDGFGRIVGYDHLRLDHLSEEHGIILDKNGDPVDLPIGTRLTIVPNHICPAVALYDEAYFVEGGRVEKVVIEGRGKRI